MDLVNVKTNVSQPMDHKKKTDWRKILIKYGSKVINNPFKYTKHDNSVHPYTKNYFYHLRWYLKKLWNKMHANEPEKQIL